MEAVSNHDEPATAADLAGETELSQTKVNMALQRLEQAGAVALLPTGATIAAEEALDPVQAVEDAVTAHAQRKEYERSRITMMQGYAELRGCRREYLLNYFGEETSGPCGYCDNCEAGITPAQMVQQPFPINSRVTRGQWGQGQVLRYEGDGMVVLFDDVGYKTLAVAVVAEHGLLAPTE